MSEPSPAGLPVTKLRGEGVASYGAIHLYLRNHFPKSGVCDECGRTVRTDYALIKGRAYSRNREDYRELCRRCHVLYDDLGYCRYWENHGLAASGPVGDAPACKCGCGTVVAWNKRKNLWAAYAPGHYRKQNVPYKDEAWLRNEYAVRQRTLKQIATDCGVNRTTITHFMERFGIERIRE
jgi:hypothetical protein